jgi:hypothetical protein
VTDDQSSGDSAALAMPVERNARPEASSETERRERFDKSDRR